MGSIPPGGGLNKGTKAPTIDVATHGCDDIKRVVDKTAPRIWVFPVWVLQSRYLGGCLAYQISDNRVKKQTQGKNKVKE